MSKARAAAISNAMVKDAGATALAIPPTGHAALFNAPGVVRSRRRLSRRVKANWSARVGQTIAGNLVRGAGGRFSASGKPSARSKRTEARRERAEQRRLAREDAAAQEQATRADEDAYIAAGKTGRERQQRRAEIAAKRRERAAARRAANAEAVAQERATRAEEDAEDAAAAEAGGGGGGGKKPKPSDDEKEQEQQRKRAENRAKTAPQAGLSADEAAALAALAEGTAGAESRVGGAFAPDRTATQKLESLGLAERGEATDAGRRLLNALERGDVRGALAAIQDGKARLARGREREQGKRQRAAEQKRRAQERAEAKKKRDAERAEAKKKRDEEKARTAAERAKREQDKADAEAERKRRSRERTPALAAQIIRNLETRRRRKAQRTYGGTLRADLPDSVFAGPDRSFPIVTAQDVRDAVRSLGRTKHDKARVRRGVIRRARAIGAMDALPESWKAAKAFTVFKDARGRDRWLAITTTAYEDKDAEFITRKAIRGVVAAGDSGAPRGPLRFWHVPGLDLGDCDYQASAYGDRVLIESGTFRGKAAARIGQAAAARGYQMSPGFLHARKEPSGGRFDHIALFERSFVPPGRASNPYTRLLTKEIRMLTTEKRKEFEALAADPESRALLETLLSQAEATVKAADDAGAVYKDAPAWAQALISRLDALEATVKAPMPPAEMVEAGETELADGEAELDAELAAEDGAADDMMDDEGFAQLIVDKLLTALGPLLELEKKMAGWAGEIKAALPQAMAQKDDAVAAIDARVKALEGDQPRAARQHYAAGVWEGLVGQTVTKEQAAALAARPAADAPAGLSAAEAGAYKLIFGE